MRRRTDTRSSWSARRTRSTRRSYEKLSFNFLRDIAPVAGIISIPYVMAVNPSVPSEDGSRVHRLCQGQPGQDQPGDRAASGRRAIMSLANCSR